MACFPQRAATNEYSFRPGDLIFMLGGDHRVQLVGAHQGYQREHNVYFMSWRSDFGKLPHMQPHATGMAHAPHVWSMALKWGWSGSLTGAEPDRGTVTCVA